MLSFGQEGVLKMIEILGWIALIYLVIGFIFSIFVVWWDEGIRPYIRCIVYEKRKLTVDFSNVRRTSLGELVLMTFFVMIAWLPFWIMEHV